MLYQGLHTKTKVLFNCPDFLQQENLPSLELTPTVVHIKIDRSGSYIPGEARTLFNSSLHYSLFSREVKKLTLLSRKPHRVSQPMHQHGVPVKETYRNLKIPQSRQKTSNSTFLTLHPYPPPESIIWITLFSKHMTIAGTHSGGTRSAGVLVCLIPKATACGVPDKMSSRTGVWLKDYLWEVNSVIKSVRWTKWQGFERMWI